MTGAAGEERAELRIRTKINCIWIRARRKTKSEYKKIAKAKTKCKLSCLV